MTPINDKIASPPPRLDKWLWAARFFKTRALAVTAVAGGKVLLNAARAKPARTIAVGDRVSIRQGPYEWVMEVLTLSDKRGPAAQAQQLYRETPESRERREALAIELKAQAKHLAPAGKPSKKDRRDIKRFRRGPC